jgi:hypothetical protein
MKFNDDLLLSESDKEAAKRAYPSVYFALDFPEIVTLFKPYDVAANKAKNMSRRAGVIAITFGLIGWFLAVAEPSYDGLGFPKKIILLCSALFGVASVVVGINGVLFSSSKHKWLQNRFVTERIRQFFFQNFVFHLSDICLALEDKDAQEAFRRDTLARFEPFKASLTEKTAAEFDRVVNGDDNSSYWVIPSTTLFYGVDAKKHNQVFSAYRELRIIHQLDYAWHNLRQPQNLFDFPARHQEALFGSISMATIAILFLLNFFQLFAILFGEKLINDPWSYIVSIWIAIIPLAIRTLEEGLQPQREVERYENYRNICKLKKEAYESARSTEEKCALMIEMERASIEEMRLFLKTHLSARFVM